MSNGITMCENPEECPYRNRCLRGKETAPEGAPLKPFYRPGEKCGHFMSAYPYRAEVRPCVGSDIMDDPT